MSNGVEISYQAALLLATSTAAGDPCGNERCAVARECRQERYPAHTVGKVTKATEGESHA
jgi:hypothetical protein